ncbi:MAG: hypothetical protein FWF29_02395 [Treponema sp.]|nr:hypothetical protein [Treponema sp.]
MITVTIFRSALGVNDDTKETIQVEKEQKIKELFPGVDFTNSLISVNGVYQDENYLLKDGDIAAIRLFPEGDNTGAIIGGVLGGILGVVAGVLAVWFSPILIITLPMIIGTAFTWGAVGASVGAGVGEIIQHGNLNRWLGNTNSSASRDQVEQIPQLRGAKNQPAYGNPVPLVLGRHLFTPMYVGKPYTEIGGEDGEDQYFKALYLLGYSKLKVTNLKLGEIGDLASNWETETKDDGDLLIDGAPFLSDGDPHLELIQTNRESNIYPQAVNEEQLSIELTYPQGDKPLDVVRFSARNPMKVQVEFTFPNGLVKYDSSGKLTYFPVSISIKWRVSTPDDSEDFVDFGPIIGPDIVYFNSMSTITRKKAKAMRFIAEKTFSGYSEVSKTGDTRIIEIEIQRVSENSVDTNVLDKVYLTAIRTWMFDSKKSEGGILVPQSPVNERLRGRTARLGFSIKASQNTQGILDALNCIVESKCRTWDKIKKEWSDPEWDIEKQDWTGAGAETPSNNPASVALKLLQSPSMGRKAYPDSMLDLDSFGDFYKCAKKTNTTATAC